MEPKKQQTDETPKEPYEAPELVIHGDVDELTKFNQAGPTDGDGGINSQMLY